MYSKEQIQHLKNTLILLKPDLWIQQIKTFDDIIENKNQLKYSKYSLKTYSKILDIIIKKIDTKKRFQKEKSISILKWLNQKRNKKQLSRKIIDKIFYIYKNLIFNSNENICWSLSTLLKDQILSEHQLKWLTDNAIKSDFILNRVLRYPIKSRLISTWAKDNVNIEAFKKRNSEFIGLILNYYPDYRTDNKISMIWGIYYSKLSNKVKIKRLSENLNFESFYEFLEVAKRLELYTLLDNVYNKFINKLSKQ